MRRDKPVNVATAVAHRAVCGAIQKLPVYKGQEWRVQLDVMLPEEIVTTNLTMQLYPLNHDRSACSFGSDPLSK